MKKLNGRVAISYARYSSHGQKDSDSLRRQAKIYEESIALTGATKADFELVDEAKSGYKGEHVESGELGQFIEQVKEMHFDNRPVLFIEKWDRLGRQKSSITRDTLSKLLKYVDVYDCSDGQLVTTETEDDLGSSIMLLVKIHAAWQYSKNLSDRITEVKREQVRQAYDKGTNVIQGNYPRWLRYDNGALETIPERVSTVRNVFSLFLNGMSMSSIAKKLNDSGQKSWDRAGADCTWNSQKVSKLLNSQSVTGRMYSTTLEANIDTAYPQVVSEDDFNKVQSMRRMTVAKAGNKDATRDGRNIIPKTKCGMCGSSYVLEWRKSKPKYSTFVCRDKKFGGKCESSAINYHLAEEMLLELIFSGTDISSLFDDNTDDTVSMKIEAIKLELAELKKLRNERKASGKRTTTISMDIDDLEDELDKLSVSDSQVVKSEFKDFKDWASIKEDDYDTRMRCGVFLNRVVSSIELTSLPRSTKLLRVVIKDRVIMASHNKKKTTIIDGSFERDFN